MCPLFKCNFPFNLCFFFRFGLIVNCVDTLRGDCNVCVCFFSSSSHCSVALTIEAVSVTIWNEKEIISCCWTKWFQWAPKMCTHSLFYVTLAPSSIKISYRMENIEKPIFFFCCASAHLHRRVHSIISLWCVTKRDFAYLCQIFFFFLNAMRCCLFSHDHSIKCVDILIRRMKWDENRDIAVCRSQYLRHVKNHRHHRRCRHWQ